jgi:imidazolonepropionase-like amidohydrolase
VTSAVSLPVGGLISGRSAWLDLVGPRSKIHDRAVQDLAALHGYLGESGASAVGGSRASAIGRLREALDDARNFRRNKTAFTRRALYPLSSSRLDLEALGEVVIGRAPLFLEAHRASDIKAAIALARAERIRVVIVGAAEGWLVADALAAARIPVIVDPLENLPYTFASRNARADNATLLARAGVKVAIATRSSHNAANLRFYLGNAVRAGLVREVALRAGTLTPAEIFGMNRLYGSIDRGKMANVVVWTGDPFEPSSFAETVVIRGEVQPTDSRQTRLAERYLRKLGLRKKKK